MRPAVLLGVGALLAAGSASAQSIINPSDLEYQDQQMLIYAQETMTATGATTLADDPVPYATVKVPGGALTDVTVRMQNFIFKSNESWFLRLDFEGFRMESGHIAAYWGNTDTFSKTRCYTLGARNPGTWVRNVREGRGAVYRVSGYNDPQTGVFNSWPTWCVIVDWEGARDSGDVVQLQPGYATFRASLYEKLSDAISGNPDGVILRSSAFKNVTGSAGDGGRNYDIPAAQRMAFVGSATYLQQSTPNPATTASVERGFAAFLPRSQEVIQVRLGDRTVPYTAPGGTATTAQLAGVDASMNRVQRTARFPQVLDRDSNVVNPAGVVSFSYRHAGTGVELTGTTAAQLIQSAQVDLKGDFSQGTFRLTGAAGGNCPGRGAGTLTLNEAKTVASGTLTGAAGCMFSMDVKENADNEAAGKDFFAIKAQKFTADIDITLATSAPLWPPAKKTDMPAGEIKRDGTTVNLPYLTTRPGYMHKLVLVNRGTKPAEFWVENISSSDGASPSARTTASQPMTVAAGAHASVAVTDLLDFGTGGTEGAATLSVNAAKRNVAVTTVLTNMASNSTDTMTLEPSD